MSSTAFTRTSARRSPPRQSRPAGSRGFLLGGVRLRWRVWLRRPALDRELADGIEPTSSNELSLRAGQLGSAAGRERLARALENVVARAEAPPREPRNLPPVLRRTQILISRRRLLKLADTVRESDPRNVPALAAVALMIGDADSALYESSPAPLLAPQVTAALEALES